MTEQEHNANSIDNLATNPVDNGEPVNEPQASFEDLKRSLETKTAECRASQDKYLRLAAEFDNYKRLTQRDQRDQIRFGNEQLLKELLPVVDNLERAIQSGKQNGANEALTQGVELTFKQLLGALSKFGVKAIDSVGQPFDPTTQQAVAYVGTDSVPPQHVVEEFQKGYLLHDRILRASMVSVSKGPAADEPDANETHDIA